MDWNGVITYGRNFMHPFGKNCTLPCHIMLFRKMRDQERCALAIAIFGFVPGDTVPGAYRILFLISSRSSK
jgi:hypothetical protein